MYTKLVSLEITEPVTLQTSYRDLRCSPLSGKALFSAQNHQRLRFNAAEFSISESVDILKLIRSSEDRTPSKDRSPSGRALLTAVTKEMGAKGFSPSVCRSRKEFAKCFHTVKEVDILVTPNKSVTNDPSEDEHESGKENYGPLNGHSSVLARCALDSSPLAQVSPSTLRGDKERSIKKSCRIPSPVVSFPASESYTASKHGSSERRACLQQPKRKPPSSSVPLSESLSKTVVKNNPPTDSHSPLFDPDMVASYEEALKNISEDNWNACLVDSPSNSQRASATKVMERRSKMAVYEEANIQKEVDGKLCVNLSRYSLRCPPGGDATLVLYTTTLRGIRKTFEDCNCVRSILQTYRLRIDERDVSMHLGFLNELRGLMDRLVSVPRLFIRGRYIGGVEEVTRLHDNGELNELFEGLPRDETMGSCDGCDGIRFVPCLECRGSCRIRCDDNTVKRCPDCNENGLIQCPICR
ncbi:hypothetical protein KP509_23G015000 [Ceratopteris richardii]|nr:hypothetical protein KP509_23G015000 [Ceratopteris richardii]